MHSRIKCNINQYLLSVYFQKYKICKKVDIEELFFYFVALLYYFEEVMTQMMLISGIVIGILTLARIALDNMGQEDDSFVAHLYCLGISDASYRQLIGLVAI